MATEKQILANQRNAEKSTGPRTEEGKAKSRGNAFKHGLAGDGTVLSETMSEAVAARKAAFAADFSVGTLPTEAARRGDWLAEIMAIESARLDRCHVEMRVLEARHAASAEVRWDDDRRVVAEALADGLARRPAIVARQLGAGKQGCELMIDRWDGLVAALDAAPWTDRQRSLALDLLGIHPDLRTGITLVDLPEGSEPEALAAHRVGVARAEIARLRDAVEDTLASLDDFDRRMAVSGNFILLDASAQRLSRYEREAWRRFQWALRELRALAKANGPSQAAKPAAPRPAPASPIERLLEGMAAPIPPRPVATPAPAFPPTPAPSRARQRPLSRQERRALARQKTAA